MNNQERNLLKGAINTRLKRIELILELNDPDTDFDQGKDESARLDELSHKEVDASLINSAKAEKSRLKENLEWVQSEDAGNCMECGEKIPLQRLLAIPTTRLCVDCAASRH